MLLKRRGEERRGEERRGGVTGYEGDDEGKVSMIPIVSSMIVY